MKKNLVKTITILFLTLFIGCAAPVPVPITPIAPFVPSQAQVPLERPAPQEGTAYIKPLTPGDPSRILGQYPGLPDANGVLTVHVIGKGIAPENSISKGQAILLAERAAVADGYRKLAEKIQGIYIAEWARLENEAVDYDIVKLETETWIRGAEIMKIKQIDNGITEVYMRSRIYVSPDHILYKRVGSIIGPEGQAS
ncbi:MAG: hypothetical protein HQK76_11140 [Desulfobacterales bacterium]|nr:hypothetical protein [Desulfobacterales bacterium]